MTTYRVCFCYRRNFHQASTDPPPSIKDLFRRFSNGGVMGHDQLLRFLIEVQGEGGGAAGEIASRVIEGFRESHKHLFHRKGGGGGISLDAFVRYLFGDDNPPLSAEGHQDMTSPLSHYFIYTGHNSYLTGNQLSSDCSDIPIIKALRGGVRVIELDMWPNSTKDNVDILHGRTLTAPVDLLKCLTSIKEHAFSTSLYPVIITLEDHLTPDLQAKVADMINETYGEMLFIPDSENLEKLPSPEALKMKIIISTKPPKEYLEDKVTRDNGLQKGKESAEGDWGDEVPDLNTMFRTDSKVEDDGSEHFQDVEDLDDKDQKPNQSVASEYKRLIAIGVRKRKGGYEEMFKVDPNKVTRLSVSEQLLEKAAVTHGTEIVRFTENNLVRVFPKTTRIMSSNYNPLVGWLHGAQMVAFNMQGYGRPLWLMHGMFRANGGCGYVKKPDFLLKNDQNGQVFNPSATLPIKKTLKVRVYMGDGWRLDFHQTHFDTYSPPDFYTRVGIAGAPADTVMKRTKVIEDNWAPVWDEEFSFPLTVPELALLQVEVHEYDLEGKDEFAGQTCLPISELRMGIRSVPLCDRKGEQLKSVKILMHFEFI